MKFKTFFNVLFYIFSLILSLYFFFSFFSSSLFSQQVFSEIVEETSFDDYIDISGIALRDEVVLYSDEDYRFIQYNYPDGARIARYSQYASYNPDNISENQMQILSYLDKKRDRLSETLGKSTQYTSLLIEQNIKNSIISFLNADNSNDYIRKIADFNDIQSSFDQKLLQNEGSSYIKGVIDSINEEIEQIHTETGAVLKSLYSPSAGYFYSNVDGYEYLNMSDYQEPTVAMYNTLMHMPKQEVSKLAVGKLQHYSYWSFIAEVPSDIASDLYVGKSIILEFELDDVGSTRVATFVDYISRPVNDMNSVRFRCGTLTSELFGIRKQSPHMILKTYTGLKVSNDALRVLDNVTGVFVLSAQRILFKPVEILFVTDEYSLVKPKISTGEYALKAQDEVVIGGKGLSDKKIMNYTKND